jgi:hypothetical protein
MTSSRAALVIFLALLVLALHAAGLGLELYWRIGWYNWLVHALAGAVAALTIISIGFVRDQLQRPLPLFVAAIVISLVVGILWEVFEVKGGIEIMSTPGYALYTLGDIISDVVGGFLAGSYMLLFG